MPKIVDHDKYRSELLSSCFELFAQRGFSTITMREISKELKVSTGTLYHYFSTKQSILEDMFMMQLNRILKEVVPDINSDMNYQQKIDIVFSYIVKHEKFFENYFLMTIDYYRHSEAKKKKKFMQKISQEIGNSFSTHFMIEESLGHFVFMFLSGLIYHRAVYYRSIDIVEHVELFKEMLILYLEKRF
jgi:DNA-binding transcriptional regulator YbjK